MALAYIVFLKLLFIFYVTSCFEYTPYDVLIHKNAKQMFSCGKVNDNSRILWFKTSCDFKNLIFIKIEQNFIFGNKSLHLVNMDNKCNYYRCLHFENDVVVYENTFRIAILGSHSNKYSVINFHGTWIFKKSITFNTNLKKSDKHKLSWFLWENETFFIINNNAYISIYGNHIEISSSLNLHNIGFIPCLIGINTDKIFECGNSSFIRSTTLSEDQTILYTNANDYVILYCKESTRSKKIWYKDGNEINFDDRINYNYSSIIITNYVSSDDGYYQCITKKPFQLPYNLSIFLVTFNNNKFNYSILVSKNKKEMSDFVLPCNNPYKNRIPKFMLWTFNILKRISYALIFDHSVVDFDLNIYDANVYDTGLYQCLVYIPTKLTIYSFLVHIETEENFHIIRKRSLDEAGEITNLKFKAFANSIHLSWSPPNSVVKKYIIHWGDMYPGPQQQNIDGKETKFTIPSLRQKTTYFINIVAETVSGPSKQILRHITTKEKNKEIFLTIPVNLKLLEVGDTWSRISWESRNNEENNDIISDKIYQVEYCPIRSQRGHKIYRNTTKSILKITDVKPATTYEFAVRSCLINSSKCNDWSMVQEFTTLGTKPGDPPQLLTLSTVQLSNGVSENSKSNHMFAVQVSWQPPKDPNGEIKNYLILVTAEKRLDISNWGERTVSGKTLNTVIDRLDMNRYYYFRIRCSNEYGKSPLSSIRIFKTPNEFGKEVGPVYLSKEYYDPMEIIEELKLSRSIERGPDDLSDINTEGKKPSKNDKLGLAGFKWWIIIGIVIGASLIFILIIFFLVAIKCRNENSNFEFTSKASKKGQKCNPKYGMDTNENVKFVNKAQLLTTPDLFRHTKDPNCHSNYLELEERNESPNSFSSSNAFPGLNHSQPFSSQKNYHNNPGHYTPPGLIHQQNIVMTTSQLTSSSNERHFYQVPFIHHVGHNSFNVFANSAPRVNAAASDFNSINIPSPISDFSDFTSSQATVLYDTSTAKSSGGKSSLSGSGSYNNGLGTKSSLKNEPILEAYCSDKKDEREFDESIIEGNCVSKAFSSEELCQEMANLEGLMKDLNNITQKEFEC